MPFAEGGNEGVLNGVTAVTVVPAPLVDVRRLVRSIVVFNADAASVTLTIRHNKGGTFRRIAEAAVASKATWKLQDYTPIVVLDATDEKIEAVLAAGPTTQPEFVAAWGDASEVT